MSEHSQMLTVSPMAKSPSTATTPEGSRLFPPSRMATAAPASINTRPTGSVKKANQRFDLPIFADFAKNSVPRSSAATRRCRFEKSRPSQIHKCSPADIQSSAAFSLVIIPPTESALPSVPAAIARKSSPISSTSEMRVPSVLPSRVCKPSTVVSNTVRSARIMVETKAASVSLSPKRISSTLTVSFSFITGKMFCC